MFHSMARHQDTVSMSEDAIHPDPGGRSDGRTDGTEGRTGGGDRRQGIQLIKMYCDDVLAIKTYRQAVRRGKSSGSRRRRKSRSKSCRRYPAQQKDAFF